MQAVLKREGLTTAAVNAHVDPLLMSLAAEQGLLVITNTMSTQIFGEYDTVMRALQRCMRWSMEHYGKLVFVCKFIPGDLRP